MWFAEIFWQCLIAVLRTDDCPTEMLGLQNVSRIKRRVSKRHTLTTFTHNKTHMKYHSKKSIGK